MKCNDIKFATYDCSYNIMPPFKCGTTSEFRYVAVDKCLIKEVIDLWEKGIRTTGCCCGHGEKEKAFIGVKFEDIEKMKALGYEVRYNPLRPNDEDSFVPKTPLNYGEIQKGFNWWEENTEETITEDKQMDNKTEAEPKVKHGEWVRQEGRPEAVCSECGRQVVYQIINNKWEFENYCPHCGTKMDGKQEE